MEPKLGGPLRANHKPAIRRGHAVYPNGNVEKRQDVLHGPLERFVYDALGRLTVAGGLAGAPGTASTAVTHVTDS